MTENRAFEEIARRRDLAKALGAGEPQAIYSAIQTASDGAKKALRSYDICVKALYLVKYMQVRTDEDIAESKRRVEMNMKDFREKGLIVS